jgi:hypothetical protein
VEGLHQREMNTSTVYTSLHLTPPNVVFNMALQRKSYLCIARNGIARPNFHIHLSVSDLYIPRIGPHIFLQHKRQIDRGTTYINRSQTYECGNWNWPRNYFSGNICFECSILCICSWQRSVTNTPHYHIIPCHPVSIS